MARKRSWNIEEAGIRVRIYRRGGRYWLDVRDGERRQRVPAKTSERATAETNARALAKEIARHNLLGIAPDTLTLGELFAAYEQHKGRTLEGQWRRASLSRQRLFLSTWSAELPVSSISQSTVDAFSATRRAAWLAKQEGAERPRPLRDGALDADFRWLSSVFNWATRHKLSDGKRLLAFNPLHDCRWPREKNVRRPVASHERYVRTVEQAERVDAAGRLRLAAALARHAGRRIDAILKLLASDVLLTQQQVAAALASTGSDERMAEHMPHGAIRWRAEHDKQGLERITPISDALRAELDRYLQRNGRIGDVPLLPSPEKPTEPLSRHTATKWLAHAERLADLPKLAGGLWHAYRRLWATERKHLPDVDVAFGGGWTGTKAMKLAYQQPTPDGVLAAVMGG